MFFLLQKNQVSPAMHHTMRMNGVQSMGPSARTQGQHFNSTAAGADLTNSAPNNTQSTPKFSPATVQNRGRSTMDTSSYQNSSPKVTVSKLEFTSATPTSTSHSASSLPTAKRVNPLTPVDTLNLPLSHPNSPALCATSSTDYRQGKQSFSNSRASLKTEEGREERKRRLFLCLTNSELYFDVYFRNETLQRGWQPTICRFGQHRRTGVSRYRQQPQWRWKDHQQLRN